MPIAEAEALELEEAFLSGLNDAQDAYERIVAEEAWTALGHETFADWWGQRVQPTMRALRLRPTPELAAAVVGQVRKEEAELPPLQRRTHKELADLAGTSEWTARGRQDHRERRTAAESDLEVPVPDMPKGQDVADAILADIDATPRREPAPRADRPAPVMLKLRTHTGEEFDYRQPSAKATFNETTGEGISWAAWSWNPVTGCLHNCEYCDARAIAARFPDGFPAGFTPLFHEERLDAPSNTSVPAQHRGKAEYKRVFVCSMADLYGRWVPDEWIGRVHDSMAVAPWWEYLLLTKFPSRYPGLSLPPNAWVGTSVDAQKRVRIAADAFRQIDGVKVKWLSLEPLREPLEFTDLSMFDWVVIGAQTETRQPTGTVDAFMPPWEWVCRITAQAKEAGCLVHWKPNLFNGRPGLPPNEYPS